MSNVEFELWVKEQLEEIIRRLPKQQDNIHALTAERKRAVLVNALVDSVRVWYKDSGRFDIIRARLHQLDAFDRGEENG